MEQVTSPISLSNLSVPQASPTVNTPPVAPIAKPTATGTPRRQDGISPPHTQPPTTPAGISGLDPIAESVGKDSERFMSRLVQRLEAVNKAAQATGQDINLAHNAQGGTIRIPGSSLDQAIHEALRELLESGDSAALRRFQETSMKMNQILTVSGVVPERHKLTKCSGNPR